MTQKEALTILKTGASVFLTGGAGSGKTHTVNRYTEYLREHGIEFAVTASTGIAATHIHGLTIHSWSGIGIASTLSDDDIKHIAENQYVTKRIRGAKVLIIDEISMLDGRVLSPVERVCRKVRKVKLPFGGLQVVLVGDFFQLPPVASPGQSVEFAFESEAWQQLVPTVCYLSEQYRQEDTAFLEVLSAIRRNECEEGHFETIRERLMSLEEVPDDMTRLFSHNANVDELNKKEPARLPGKKRAFIMALRGPQALTDTLKRGCLSPETLELKEGAAVMFTKNNPGAGFVNGTLGVVTGFDEEKKYPIVKTSDGRMIRTEPMEWVIAEGDEVFAKITQLPLRLAWAMTIHKSQGVSLDAAVMDLSQTFEYGQGYVALSRVRRLSGVHLLGINARALQVHPVVLEIDQVFRQASFLAASKYREITEERLKELNQNFIILSGGQLTPVLKKKRQGKGESTPAKLLEKIRREHPQAYRGWSSQEGAQLRRLFNKGVQMREMAETLGRKPGAIRSRLKKLGLPKA